MSGPEAPPLDLINSSSNSAWSLPGSGGIAGKQEEAHALHILRAAVIPRASYLATLSMASALTRALSGSPSQAKPLKTPAAGAQDSRSRTVSVAAFLRTWSSVYETTVG